VLEAKLIMKPPHMQVRLKPGAWPDLARMQETIGKAGYAPIRDAVDLHLTGSVVRTEAGYALQLDGMKPPRTVLLAPPAGSPDPAAGHLGAFVEVTGRWVWGAPEATVRVAALRPRS
jgi:hypothetical protein